MKQLKPSISAGLAATTSNLGSALKGADTILENSIEVHEVDARPKSGKAFRRRQG
jgi:hypothetical protein